MRITLWRRSECSTRWIQNSFQSRYGNDVSLSVSSVWWSCHDHLRYQGNAVPWDGRIHGGGANAGGDVKPDIAFDNNGQNGQHGDQQIPQDISKQRSGQKTSQKSFRATTRAAVHDIIHRHFELSQHFEAERE